MLPKLIKTHSKTYIQNLKLQHKQPKCKRKTRPSEVWKGRMQDTEQLNIQTTSRSQTSNNSISSSMCVHIEREKEREKKYQTRLILIHLSFDFSNNSEAVIAAFVVRVGRVSAIRVHSPFLQRHCFRKQNLLWQPIRTWKITQQWPISTIPITHHKTIDRVSPFR